MKTELYFLFSSIFLGACGQVLLKLAANNLGEVKLNRPELLHTVFRLFTNGWIVLGIFFFVSSMVLWIKVISSMDLGKAYPSVSISYLIVFFLSVFIFKETVNLEKVFGLIFISLGVFFLHR